MAMLQHIYTQIGGFLKRYLLVMTCLMISSASLAQPIPSIVSKGNRPPIDIDKIPASAYKPNRLNLKFQPRFRNNLEHIHSDADGNILCGIALVDALNKKYHLKKATSLFGCKMQDGELYKQHQLWGFDRWYSVSFEGNVDIKEVLLVYKQTNAFEVVEPVYKASVVGNPPPFIPNDPILHYQWDLHNAGLYNGTAGKDISMFDAWGITTGDPSVIVSVHDNAININHEDIAQNIAQGLSHNFIDNNDSLTLNTSHGIHCAGIIGAVSNNGVGMSGIAGGNGSVNSGIRLMSCEIFGPNDSTGGFAESLVYAADKGASVSNNSWGYDQPDVYEEAVLDAIDYFNANGGGSVLNGGVVVFAAGNNGKNWRIYPGGYERVISVAATNNQDKKSSYSNYGNWLSLSAPGGEGFMEGGIFSLENHGYGSSSGTSFAAPHVVGVAALVASVLKGKASGNDVREILLSTTDNNYPQNPSFLKMLGTGRLNAYTALQKAQSFANKSINSINNFNASYQCNYFNVNWINTGSNNVIVAYNNTSTIGTLMDGSVYSVGDSLIGGGVIVYKGNGNSFNFPIIETENQYSFKIWVVGNNNQYSFSKMAESFAKPIIRNAGDSALQQNFDFPPLYPTKIWHGTDTRYDFSSWMHTANDTSSTGAGDDYSMCLYNYQYNKVLGAVDTLTGPQLWVKGADSVALTFWHAYQFTDKHLPYSDSLEVVVSKDCGKTYTSLWKKGGRDLATVPDTANVKFYPFGGISKWKKDTVNLSSFRSADKILIGFKGYNGRGNNLFLDNINVAVHYKTDVAITNVYLPVDSACGNSNAEAILKNKGLSTIKSCTIGYQIDGGKINVAHLLNNIIAGDSAVVNLSIQTSVGIHSLKVFSYLPNNIVDDNTANDTLLSTITILPIDTLPFVESFEDSTLPLSGWQLGKQPGNDFSWLRTTTAASNGKASVFAQNFIYTNYGFYENIISPPINITHQIDSLFLLFDVAAAIQADSINIPWIDTLQIDMTKDCGNTWTTIYKKWGSNLQTVAPVYNEFVPTATQWRTDSIALTGKANGGDVIRFRFRDIENGSNDIYLDNVRVYAKTLHAQVAEKGLMIYPNPFKNNITIQHYLPPTTLQAIAIYDDKGRRVRTFNYKGSATTTETLGLEGIDAGFYTVELIYTDKKVVKKIIKMDR